MGKKPGSNAVQGVCFLCGQETTGIPADGDLAIRLARSIRAILRMEPRHTVACQGCLQECRAKRGAFEGKLQSHKMGAAVFFAMVVLCSLALGGFSARLLAAALIGAGAVAILAYASYCPKFGFSEKK